jgi:hypothetical protein
MPGGPQGSLIRITRSTHNTITNRPFGFIVTVR